MGEALKDGVGVSYTHWEAWLALYHGKLLLTAKAEEAAIRGPKYSDGAVDRGAAGFATLQADVVAAMAKAGQVLALTFVPIRAFRKPWRQRKSLDCLALELNLALPPRLKDKVGSPQRGTSMARSANAFTFAVWHASINTSREPAAPRSPPVVRRFRVQQSRRFLHLRNVVGCAQLLVLLIGGGIADIGAIAPGGVGVDVDTAVLPLGVGDRVLRQRLKLRGLLRRVRLQSDKTGSGELPLLLRSADACAPAKGRHAASATATTVLRSISNSTMLNSHEDADA